MRWGEAAGEVWLVVEPTDEVKVEDVVHELDAAGYCELDVRAIAAAISSLEQTVVGRVDENNAAGSLEVVVGPGGRTATLTVRPPGPNRPPFTAEDVEAALAEVDVVLGVDHLLIGSLPLDVPGEYLVASGWEPSPGRDGRIQFTVDLDHEFRPRPRSDGGVDFHAVASIPDVRIGQLLAVLVDPTPGTPGRTVRGELVPAGTGDPAELPTGENVSSSEDLRRVHAAIDGLLEITRGRVSVRPDFVVDGDVDFESGSVTFSGDVIIRGSVLPGFTVRAEGRVVVMGDVDEAEVIGGTLVWVRGAVVGSGAVIRSEGDVKVRTLHKGRIEARRNVYIEREAHDSSILAGLDVVLEGARNRLSGGSVWAGHQIMAAEIGAVGGTATRVSVGVDPFTAELLEQLRGDLVEHRRILERIEQAVVPFLADPRAIDALPEHRQEAVQRLHTIRASLRAQVSDVEQRIADLQIAPDDARPRVVARLAMRPGTVVAVRDAAYVVRTTQHRVAATILDGQVTLVPLGSEAVPAAPPLSA